MQTRRYGFIQELQDKFGEAEGRELYKTIQEKLFFQLPVAAVIQGRGKVFVSHGGLPVPEADESLLAAEEENANITQCVPVMACTSRPSLDA